MLQAFLRSKRFSANIQDGSFRAAKILLLSVVKSVSKRAISAKHQKPDHSRIRVRMLAIARGCFARVG